MRLVPILTLGLLLLGSAKCQEEEYEPQYYTPAEWAVWIGRIRGFDEIRMTLAVKYIEYPTKWSKEGIKYEERPVFDSLLHEAK
ncbi:MAG TPA: hypothetical protein PK640_10555, partial [Verrucomicrobiota bacterium]|nr:hypothetical protein [Verrucomicrobiota bacterium]